MSNRYGISEIEISEMRNKLTSDSTLGDILMICRDTMTAETFEKILPTLL